MIKVSSTLISPSLSIERKISTVRLEHEKRTDSPTFLHEIKLGDNSPLIMGVKNLLVIGHDGTRFLTSTVGVSNIEQVRHIHLKFDNQHEETQE